MNNQISMRLCKRCCTESVVIALSVPPEHMRPIPVYGALLITPEAEDSKPQIIIHCRACKLGFTHTLNAAFWYRASASDISAIITRTLDDIRDYGRSLRCVLCNESYIGIFQDNGVTFASCPHCGWRSFANSSEGDPVDFFARSNRIALAVKRLNSKSHLKRAT